jgi:acyl CoA:acetate/3-ketoacid CoA transferase beta subunit
MNETVGRHNSLRLPDAAALTLLISREFQKGDRVHVGANQTIILNATILANAAYGVQVRLTAVGGMWLSNPKRAAGLLTNDRRAVELVDVPLDQEHAFDDLLRSPILFAGGLQIDATGNVNLIGLGFENGAWKVRGPGSAGLPSITGLSSTFYAYTTSHDARALVEKVEHISAVGSPQLRSQFSLPKVTRGGVFTPLGRFTWDEHGRLQLAQLASGVSVDEVISRTPFTISISPGLTHASPPSQAELSMLSELSIQTSSESV